MSRLLVVIRREYLERVRTRWFLLATVFGPILFGAVLFVPAWLATREHPSADVGRIRILDATGTDLGRNVAVELNGGVTGDTSRTQVVALTAAQLAAEEARATRDVQSRTLKGYLVLEPDALSGGGARYAGVNATAGPDMRELQNVVGREALGEQLRKAGVTAEDADRLKHSQFSLHADRITAAGHSGSGRVSIFFAISVAMLLYMTILMYGQAVLRGVIEEKQTRVAEVVMSSVRPVTLLGGKVLGVGGVGLTQLIIWTVTGLLMARYRVAALQYLGIQAMPLQLPDISAQMLITLMLFFLLGYTFYSALFATVGAMVSSENEAQQAQMPVVLMLVLTLMFLQPALNAPDGGLSRTLSLLPISSPIMMPLRMSAVEVAPWEIGLSVLALIAACYLSVYVAAIVYRTGLLMYGKRVTVGELVRWMREAR